MNFIEKSYLLDMCISYLMLASIVGFYSLPLLRYLQPKRYDTPMPKVIGNCMVIVVLSSALPVLSRTLGVYHCGYCIPHANILGDILSLLVFPQTQFIVLAEILFLFLIYIVKSMHSPPWFPSLEGSWGGGGGGGVEKHICFSKPINNIYILCVFLSIPPWPTGRRLCVRAIDLGHLKDYFHF